MELPPLSPGIQAKVIEEVDVVETVKRGWSGGTKTQDIHRLMGNLPFNIRTPEDNNVDQLLLVLEHDTIYLFPHSKGAVAFSVDQQVFMVQIESSTGICMFENFATGSSWSCKFATLTNRKRLALKVTSVWAVRYTLLLDNGPFFTHKISLMWPHLNPKFRLVDRNCSRTNKLVDPGPFYRTVWKYTLPYLVPAGLRWLCQTPVCWSLCRCSTQNPRLSQNVAPGYHLKECSGDHPE